MNLADRYKIAIDDLTEGRPGGPDLTACLASGRRHRRVRRSLVGGAVATVLVAATLSAAWLQRPHQEVAIDGFADQPSYQDFVPGTDVDETMQATAADHLPSLGDPTDVYPSDWNHDGPIPDGDSSNATDWQATYNVSSQEHLLLLMGKPIPGKPFANLCGRAQDFEPGTPPCHRVDLGGGRSLVVVAEHPSTTAYAYWFSATYEAADDSVVSVFEQVEADSWAQASSRRQYTDDQLSALVRDAAMTFPDPVVTPPPPTS